jgi:hypothetical protein
MMVVARTECDDTYQITLPSPYGAKQMTRKGKKGERMVPIPSIMGLDTLEFNGLRIVYDPSRQEGYLESS